MGFFHDLMARGSDYLLALLGALVFVSTRQTTVWARITAPIIGGTLALGLSEAAAARTGLNEIICAVGITVFAQYALEVGVALLEDRTLMRDFALGVLKRWTGGSK